MKMINKNKGMYLETIMNNSINYYEQNKVALFRKQSIPIKIKEVDGKKVFGYLENKADSDYYGIYKGIFIAIEAKQTEFSYFDLHLIKKHQLNFLKNVISYGGKSFLVIYFFKTEKFYFLDFQEIHKWILQNKKKRIPENWFS